MARRVRAAALIVAACGLGLGGCASTPPHRSPAPPDCRSCTIGIATWYGAAAQGRRTASGERFDRNAMTAAHPSLPFNTRVRVVRLDNGRSVVVRITDRGPNNAPGRIIDVSEAAARELNMIRDGIARVRVEPLVQ